MLYILYSRAPTTAGYYPMTGSAAPSSGHMPSYNRSAPVGGPQYNSMPSASSYSTSTSRDVSYAPPASTGPRGSGNSSSIGGAVGMGGYAPDNSYPQSKRRYVFVYFAVNCPSLISSCVANYYYTYNIMCTFISVGSMRMHRGFHRIIAAAVLLPTVVAIQVVQIGTVCVVSISILNQYFNLIYLCISYILICVGIQLEEGMHPLHLVVIPRAHMISISNVPRGICNRLILEHQRSQRLCVFFTSQ